MTIRYWPGAVSRVGGEKGVNYLSRSIFRPPFYKLQKQGLFAKLVLEYERIMH